jgi:hypothetical protein
MMGVYVQVLKTRLAPNLCGVINNVEILMSSDLGQNVDTIGGK